MARFAQHVRRERGIDLPDYDYDALWRWSVASLDDFWAEVWRYFGIDSISRYEAVLSERKMPGARWFPGSRVNFASRVLARVDDGIALECVSEGRGHTRVSWSELRSQVGACARTLRSLGVSCGDRVVAYLPNVPEAVIGFLAAASIGAVWAVCGPEVGSGNVVDRFAQLQPRVLLATDASVYAGKRRDRREALREIVTAIPSLEVVVHVPLLDRDEPPSHLSGTHVRVLSWADAIATPADPVVAAVDGEAPLWVVYSSGTTGVPKGLVHTHAGALVVSLAQMALQYDIDETDTYFWYTSTTWVMWNSLVSALQLGATAVLFDGSPLWPDADRLWSLAGECGATVLGVSPGYLGSSQKARLRPGAQHDLSRLRAIGVTGAPVPAASYRWVYDTVSSDIAMHVMSGGTDFAAALVCDSPWHPVTAGEMSCRALGVDLESWDANGNAVVDEVGELVVLQPVPSMPLYIWGDDDGSRYRESYFDRYPGVWRHGDWLTLTARGTAVIHGRADSTLNRHGVRIGSADVYAAVEALGEITDSLVLGIEYPDGRYWMPLFVRLAEDSVLDDTVRARIEEQVRRYASPRHVPDEIFAAPGVPRTITGKKLEVPLKRIAQGAHPTRVVATESVDDREVLRWYVEFLTSRRPSR